MGYNPYIVPFMTDEQILLAQIEAFLAASNMKPSTFGRRAANEWKFVDRLRAGRRCWPETIERVRQFMTDERRRQVEAERAS